MKRSHYVIGLAVVVVLAIAALFVPSYFAKQGLDKLAASLPAGTKFTYSDAGYSLLSRSLVLKGAVLHLASPVLDIAADEVRIQDGNPALEGAVEKAQASPDVDDGAETKLAGRVTVTGLHTVYGPLDGKAGSLVIDNPRLSLHSMLAPLPALRTADAAIAARNPLAALDGDTETRQMMQRVARATLAISYDRLDIDHSDIVIADHVSGETIKIDLGTAEVDGVDKGLSKGVQVKNLAIAVQDMTVTVAAIHGDLGDQRPFLGDLRDGLPVSTAFAHYPGVAEKIEGLTLKRGDKTLAAIDDTELKNVRYDNGIPVSMDLSVKGLTLDPTMLPGVSARSILAALGYTPAVLDFTTSYKYDPTARTLNVADTVMTLRSGGTLTVNAALAEIGPDLPKLGAKIASLAMRYEDHSLATRWVDYVAKETGKDATAVKSGYISELELQKANFAKDRPVSEALDAAEKFVANPHGLTLVAQPATPVGLADFDVQHPNGFSAKLGLKVTSDDVTPPPPASATAHLAPPGVIAPSVAQPGVGKPGVAASKAAAPARH